MKIKVILIATSLAISLQPGWSFAEKQITPLYSISAMGAFTDGDEDCISSLSTSPEKQDKKGHSSVNKSNSQGFTHDKIPTSPKKGTDKIKKENQLNFVEAPETPEQLLLFTDVDKKAEFPGGQKELVKFLNDNIKYPANAEKNKIQGCVLVRFAVDEYGNLSKIEVIKGINEELDAEAVRVASIMPRWKPAKKNGKTVASLFTLPITFRIK